jgi:hypothetical protein
VLWALVLCGNAVAGDETTVRGYITALDAASGFAILDDRFSYATGTEFASEEGCVLKSAADLFVGMLVEVKGKWTGKHQFGAGKIKCEGTQFTKEIEERTFLDYEPRAGDSVTGELRVRADGEFIVLKPEALASAGNGMGVRPLLGRQLHYWGVRQPDGAIAVSRLEIGEPAPPGAYRIPGNLSILPNTDAKTGVPILEEVTNREKVKTKLKRFSVPEVQKYVTQLGNSLLPPSEAVTTRALEFRFFVVEDAAVNAFALPDGTVLVNTGLLGAVENEAQLAFVLSHEIAHALQAHYWRHKKETDPKKWALIIAGLAGSAAGGGDLAVLLSQIGVAAILNGHSRRLENQADRIALQNLIEKGYDPREGPRLARMFIERYRARTTSKIFQSHDSFMVRGSFLEVQLQKQYPNHPFDSLKKDSPAFKQMKAAMGPVKVM